jgi:lysozyme
MSEQVNPLIVDLSHWDPADDYRAVKDDGIIGVIYKATEGQTYNDPTYVEQRQAAKAAGMLWGAYHFADGSDVKGQIANFMRFACPDPDELFVLDWEDNPNSTKMNVEQAKEWIETVEEQLDRPGECVIYGGNTLKEMIHGVDPFFAARRLWLCQYGSTPTLPESWTSYWLWQYTDGQVGPSPHSVDGIGPCDINSYAGAAEQLADEWTQFGLPPVVPSPTPTQEVIVEITAPKGVTVNVSVNGAKVDRRSHKAPKIKDLVERWRKVRESRRIREAT